MLAITPYAAAFAHAAPRLPKRGTSSRLAAMLVIAAAPVETG